MRHHHHKITKITHALGHGTRQTKIFFACGVKDRIVEVEEKEVCKYTVVFESPAACV